MLLLPARVSSEQVRVWRRGSSRCASLHLPAPLVLTVVPSSTVAPGRRHRGTGGQGAHCAGGDPGVVECLYGARRRYESTRRGLCEGGTQRTLTLGRAGLLLPVAAAEWPIAAMPSPLLHRGWEPLSPPPVLFALLPLRVLPEPCNPNEHAASSTTPRITANNSVWSYLIRRSPGHRAVVRGARRPAAVAARLLLLVAQVCHMRLPDLRRVGRVAYPVQGLCQLQLQ